MLGWGPKAIGSRNQVFRSFQRASWYAEAPDSSKYKLPAVLGGMVAVVLAISLTAFVAIGQLPLRDMWHQLIQHAIGLSSSLGSAVPSIGTEPSARLVARPRQGAVSSGPTPLGLAVEGRAEGAVVVVAGLTPDMELSAGEMVASDKWQILGGRARQCLDRSTGEFCWFD